MCEPQHAARLRALPHCPGHEDDCIRKVKGGYFCGMCNVVVSTAARVGVHVGSAAHGSRRGALLLRRAAGAGGVLARGTVLLRAAAWHGLVGDACLLCDEEFQDEDVHKTEHAHILNLVQSRALFGPGKSVYKKIDEDSYQCLTCNIVFDDASFNEHFDSTVHKTTLEQSEITDENQASDGEPNSTDINDRSIDHKHHGDVKTSIDVEQNAVTKKSQKTSEVTNVDVDDISSEPMPQYLDSKNDSKIVKEPVVKNHEINNKNEIKNNLKTKEDTEEAAETKTFEHVKENASEIGSIDVEQNVVTEESRKISKVTIVDLEDVYCEPTAQHLDSKHDEKLTLQTENGKEPAEKDNEIRNENEIKNNLIKKDIEEAAEIKTFEHGKENAPEVGSNNTDNRSQILESVSTFQKNEVNINLINDTAFCKKCTMNVDFDFNAINKHIDDHKKKTNKNEDKKVSLEHGVEANGGNKNLFTAPVLMTQKREPTTSLEDIRALAKKHGMMYNGRELHCTMCDSVLPVNIRNIEEHISGNKHKAKMPQLDVKQEPKKNMSKQLIELFVKDTKIFNDDNCLEQVINEKYCLTFLSLMFVEKTGNKLTCLACNINLSSMFMYDEHVNTPRHTKILERSCVITSLESEFVREMLPGVYHCGFCNAVTGDWKGLEKHLNTSSHKKCKGRAERRLKKHMSDVRANKTKPGVYNCSFCNYVANDWDTLNRHFSTSEHMRTKARQEQRLRKLVDGIPDPKIREQMDFQTFEKFKKQYAPNFSDSDSDSD